MKQVEFIRLLGAECSEGIMLADLEHSIVWTNSAALTMHQVTESGELGATIDEYHARFQVRYLALLPQASSEALDVAGRKWGRSHPEVLIEVKSSSKEPRAVFRMRKIVLLDELGHPNCTVLIMTKAALQDVSIENHSNLQAICHNPTAVVCAKEGAAVAINAAYFQQTASDPTFRTSASSTSTVEITGEASKLTHSAQITNTASVPPSGCLEQDSIPGLDLLGAFLSLTLNGEMRIVDVSQPWLDWLGYARDAVIGRKVFELMPAPCVERFERRTHSQPGQSLRLQHVPTDFVTNEGNLVHALVSATTVPHGADEYVMLLSICADLTPQKRLENSLAATFAIVPIPMLVHRCDDGRIVAANETFLSVTGYAVADVVGQRFDEFGSFETAKRGEAFDAIVQATGRGEVAEVTLKTSSGDKLDCMLTATKIWMLGNDCMLLILQDVSDRRRTELELMSALEAVMNDSSWFSRSVVERLAAMRAPPKSGHHTAALSDLTPRERDVLSLISLGLPDIAIAEKLGLTRSTIRNHLSTLYSKIDVKNRGSAIIWARDRCLNVTQLPLRPKRLQSVLAPGKPSPRKLAVFNRAAQAKPDVKTASAT